MEEFIECNLGLTQYLAIPKNLPIETFANGVLVDLESATEKVIVKYKTKNDVHKVAIVNSDTESVFFKGQFSAISINDGHISSEENINWSNFFEGYNVFITSTSLQGEIFNTEFYES